MSKNKFDYRHMDFDDLDDYESEELIKRDKRRINNIPQKHLDKVEKNKRD
jgi:hypothetical protein